MVNKLTMNSDKTCYLIYHTAKRKVPEGFDEIILNNSIIKRVDSVNYLGLHIDEEFSFKEHTENVISSLLSIFIPLIRSNMSYHMDLKDNCTCHKYIRK